ncbi:MAG: tRNA (N6-threonylcarbamoyladenosine(37)-N6)-methyltransferase TrmO [Chloroflexi bacterium]|nr:tRNA (N6-threonylcarbamoyladenosine(37)-N6)-methyltransferase TrmO [Chloroflexota bacterium]
MDLIQIGSVKSPQTEAVDEGWGNVVAEIELQKGLGAGLQGLSEFSHALVVFFMHEARFDWKNDVLRRPRGLDDMPEIGIFAQRARSRPNSIGVSAVEIIGVEGDIVRVRGLDAIDGTPILDIKPYFPVYDYVENARVPAWVDRLMEGYF